MKPQRYTETKKAYYGYNFLGKMRVFRAAGASPEDLCLLKTKTARSNAFI